MMVRLSGLKLLLRQTTGHRATTFLVLWLRKQILGPEVWEQAPGASLRGSVITQKPEKTLPVQSSLPKLLLKSLEEK